MIKCKKNEILIKGHYKKAYTKKDGTKVKKTYVKPYCKKDIGNKGKGPYTLPEIKDEDVLGQFGYSLKCSFEKRKKSIIKAIKKYDSLRILRRLVLIRNYSKSYKKNYDKYTKDIEFIKKMREKKNS